MVPSPTQDQVLDSVASFLTSILPPDTVVIRAQDNRVPEPPQGNFVEITPSLRGRISTSTDAVYDVKFIATAAGNVLDVTEMDDVITGKILVGATLFGTDVPTGTTIWSGLTGTGGAGTYQLSPTPNPVTLPEGTYSAGLKTITENTELVLQLDVHGPLSADNAQVIATVLRDEYATAQFAAQEPNYGVVPLYADDPRQIGFQNDQQQWEDRWIVDAHFQVNPAVAVPQQYADVVGIDVVSVEATYPN